MTEISKYVPVSAGQPLPSEQARSSPASEAVIPALLATTFTTSQQSLTPGEIYAPMELGPFSEEMSPREILLMMTRFAQKMQLMATNMTRMMAYFNSEQGKSNLAALEQLNQIAERMRSTELAKFEADRKKQEAAQKKTRIWGFIGAIAVGLISFATGNVVGGVIAFAMLAMTTSLSIFTGNSKDSESLLDKAKGGIASLLTKMGVSEKVAKTVATVMAFVAIAASLLAGNTGSLAQSTNIAAKVLKALVKFGGPVIVAGGISGAINEAAAAIVDATFKPTGDKKKDDERKQLILMIVGAVMMVIGIVMTMAGASSKITVPQAPGAAGATQSNVIMKRLADLFKAIQEKLGSSNVVRMQRLEIFIRQFIPATNAATQGILNACMAHTNFAQADVLYKLGLVEATRGFFNQFNQILQSHSKDSTEALKQMETQTETILDAVHEALKAYERSAQQI